MGYKDYFIIYIQYWTANLRSQATNSHGIDLIHIEQGIYELGSLIFNNKHLS